MAKTQNTFGATPTKPTSVVFTEPPSATLATSSKTKKEMRVKATLSKIFPSKINHFSGTITQNKFLK